MTDDNPEQGPTEIDPRLQLAAQQEQAEADAAQLAHLRQRVPVLRAQLNMALERNQQLEAQLAQIQSVPAPQDHKPKAPTKRTPARKTAAKKTGGR